MKTVFESLSLLTHRKDNEKMDQTLLPYKSLLTSEEREIHRNHITVAFSWMLATVLFFVLSVISLCFFNNSYIPAAIGIVMTVWAVVVTLRKSSAKDALEVQLHEDLRIRLQDEIFLRYKVFPSRPVTLNHEQMFYTWEEEPVKGMVYITDDGEPKFAEVR